MTAIDNDAVSIVSKEGDVLSLGHTPLTLKGMFILFLPLHTRCGLHRSNDPIVEWQTPDVLVFAVCDEHSRPASA